MRQGRYLGGMLCILAPIAAAACSGSEVSLKSATSASETKQGGAVSNQVATDGARVRPGASGDPVDRQPWQTEIDVIASALQVGSRGNDFEKLLHDHSQQFIVGCMAGKGFVYKAFAFVPDDGAYSVEVLFPDVSPENARANGYQAFEPVDPFGSERVLSQQAGDWNQQQESDIAGWREALSGPIDAESDGGCNERLQAQWAAAGLTDAFRSAYSPLGQEVGLLLDPANASPSESVELDADWSECMATNGYSYSSPATFLTSWRSSELAGPAAVVNAIAATDAQCRIDVRYRERSLELVGGAVRRFLDEHAAELLALDELRSVEQGQILEFVESVGGSDVKP